MKNNNSDCEGCRMYNECALKKLPANYCPCKQCLVKAICNSTCHIYHEFWNKYEKLQEADKECQSCVAYRVCGLEIEKIESGMNDCPCRVCLVKTLCMEDCEPYRAYWKHHDDTKET